MRTTVQRPGIRLAGAVAVLTAGLVTGVWKAEAGGTAFPSQGAAFPALEERVDPLVADLIRRKSYPGMSVAISRDGRLLLAKGYGSARMGTKFIPMTREHRSRIGSVSKAAVTGPAAFQLMQARGINPATRRLYGAGSIFGSRFDSDMRIGIERHLPIVALAIDPQDRVHAWYSNGTYSVGATNNLDQYAVPKSYAPASGRKAAEIVDAGITGNGRVYTWYDDNSVSIGTPEDLDRFSGATKDAVKLPSGKSMADVVGIAIAKSDDHVYVWYDDATVSSGTSRDFDFYFKPKPFTYGAGSGGTSYNIRGVGIAKNDHVYAWFSNGKASSGLSTRLDRYLAPYPYTMAPTASSGGEDWRAWYQKITVQNLLDHRAGFTRSGDTAGAAKMFKTTADRLTYDQVHRHFLRTRKLLYEPGKSSAYSNHGFGLWTLLIEQISGTPFPTYVRNEYLRPMGLQDRVTGEAASARENDAWNHAYSSGKPVPVDFKESGLGLAAGGFRSSAENLLRLTRALQGRYSEAQLDSMGWGKETRGKLHHNGKTGGGTAYVAMFPRPYTSVGGLDLSGVHVAVITHIETDTSDLESLASQLALQVPPARVPATFDVWRGKPVQ